MAIRTDEVQLKINFITDESRQLAKVLLDTKKYNAEIAGSEERIKRYNKELAATNITEVRRTELLAKVATEENNIAINLNKIAAAAREVEKIDLSKLTPAQMTERARQLEQSLRRIPTSAPEFQKLQSELAAVNGRLKEIRDTSRGIKADGPASGGGGIFGSIIGKVGIAVAAVEGFFAAVQGLFSFAAEAVQDFNAAAAADAALEDRLRSTEGAAGRTLEQLQAISDAQEKITLFEGEDIKKGEELLLTFTNIRSEILDRTIPAALDMSTVFQQDVSASAIQLGKALNDPVQGITALSRIGITFSDEQKKTIATMVEMNDVAGAQAIILSEVEKQVGGAAQAAANAEGGGMKKLAKRFGEIKESLGGLISKGLNLLQPAVNVVLTVMGKLVDVFTEGKAATGEYSTVVNILAGLLKAIGIVIQVVAAGIQKMWNDFNTAVSAIQRFINYLREIPIYGQFIETALITPLRFLRDAIFNLPAAWAGFVAAVKQGGLNIVSEFSALLLRVQAFAKEVQIALTFDAGAKSKLGAELNDLRTREAAAKAGKTVGQAYAEARDAVLAQAPKEAGGSTSAGRRAAPLSVGGLDEAEAEKRRKASSDLREKQFQEQLAAIEAQEKRQELLAEAARIKGASTEAQYQKQLSDLYVQGIEERLSVYRRFGREQEAEALALQNTLLEISKKQNAGVLPGIDRNTGLTSVRTSGDDTNTRLGVASIVNDTNQDALRSKFEAAIITEGEYNVRRLELERAYLDQKLNILNSAATVQIDAVRKTEEEKAKVEAEIAEQKLENTRRTEELKKQILTEGLATANDLFGVAIDLLSKDEEARKKNASTIKAFQSAQVVVAGISEVQKIWASVAQYGPLGPALGAIQTAVAVARTVASLRKISATKFAGGGYTGSGYGIPDETGHRPAGIVHANEYVIPQWQTTLPEVRPVLAWLEARRLRKYADGGFVQAPTTPTQAIFNSITASNTAQNTTMQEFSRTVALFGQIVKSFPAEVRARLSYTDIEDTAAEVKAVREGASI